MEQHGAFVPPEAVNETPIAFPDASTTFCISPVLVDRID